MLKPTQTSTALTSSAIMPFATTTTRTTTTTTSSASFVKPRIALRAPMTIIGSTENTQPNYDDDITVFTASFPLGIWDKSTPTVHVANNGYIAIGPTPSGQLGYSPQALSIAQSPNPNAHFPFWDDLYFQQGQTHGIFYQYEGTAPNRSLTFEWYGTKFSAKGAYFAHFLVSFYEALPSWCTYECVLPAFPTLPLLEVSLHIADEPLVIST